LTDADGQAPDRDDTGTEPAEHVRYRIYLNALAEVSDAQEGELLSDVLSDPNRSMAEAAVLRHLDRRAAEFDEDGQYARWCQRIAPRLHGHESPERRLEEWSLYRAITSGHEWSAADLVAASDWLQRKTAQCSSAWLALTVLADQGRTRRVRNTARSRLAVR
jgi:hypothetical protein